MPHSWQPQRRSIRLAAYDYAGDGVYFVTICTRQRAYLFGTVVDGEMYLSPAGVAVNRCWEAITTHFPHVILDSHVVMPNHLHGIITIDNSVLTEWNAAQGRARRAVPLQHDSALGDPHLERGTEDGPANTPNIDERHVGARHDVPGNNDTTRANNANKGGYHVGARHDVPGNNDTTRDHNANKDGHHVGARHDVPGNNDTTRDHNANKDGHRVGARHAVPGNGGTIRDHNANKDGHHVGARRAVPAYSGTRWDEKQQSSDPQDERSRSFGLPVAGDLATIIRSFKSAATRAVNAIRGTEGPGVWQRNYYEVIIRNEKMLNGIRQYIQANPANWAQDDLYEG